MLLPRGPLARPHGSLRKFVTLNHHFLIRGAWDSHNGFMDHITSKHIMNLRQ